jgi:hypothetical protein
MIRFWKRAIPHLVLASLLAGPIAIAGCAEHSEYRVYDPDDGSYHYWSGEQPYYQQWEVETHRRNRDFRKRNRDEQREYWQWRQNHRDDNHRDRDDQR